MAFTFEWDATKAKANLAKHGVSFDEGLTVFSDPLARLLDDPDHSRDEARFILLGESTARRCLAVAFTDRRPDRIRLISARKATRLERRQYEEGR
jgi:uncharacterized DUF497 family protein